MYYKILKNKLIQLSDKLLEGYEPVIEDENPEGNVVFNYKIIDGKVHKVYNLK